VDYNSCDDNDTLLFPSDESIIAGPMGLSGETGREEEDEAEEEEVRRRTRREAIRKIIRGNEERR
jgi:hypothetical protein